MLTVAQSRPLDHDAKHDRDPIVLENKELWQRHDFGFSLSIFRGKGR